MKGVIYRVSLEISMDELVSGKDDAEKALPERVFLGCLSFKGHPNRKPLRCVKCQRYGHVLQMDVNVHLVSWITDYLTDRPQFIRLKDCVSETVLCSTGAPQGTVLSPVLFTLYTSDFTYNSESCHIQKFSDDSAIVGWTIAESSAMSIAEARWRTLCSGVVV